MKKTTTYALEFRFKCTWKHIGEEIEQERKCEFHEWDYNNNDKRYKSEKITDCPLKLPRFATGETQALF
jgi:hypothetical protein